MGAKSLLSRIRSFNLLTTYRRFSFSRKLVLGIESSCDDTGAAVVDENGAILGEGYESQMKIHLDNGGVIPHIAIHFHQENIKNVVTSALENSNVNLKDVSAIAVTTKPGLRGSLTVGINYAMKLAQASQKPLIPIHHMEAHALTARLTENVPFPFMCLLVSGGHCQVALAKGLDEFLLLGTSQHNTPGEMLDKIARRLKLQNLPECYEMSGGKSIEFMSRGADPFAIPFPHTMTRHRDCNFSFSGFGSFAMSYIEREEVKNDVPADGVIPSAKDLCASLLYGYTLHLLHRVHRAFLYCEKENLLCCDQRSLVFSGGVACNSFIRDAIENYCADQLNCKFFAPPPRLCTDNGVMVAWNGMERLKANIGIYPCTEILKAFPDYPLGVDIIDAVKKASIKLKIPKLDLKNETVKENITLAT